MPGARSKYLKNAAATHRARTIRHSERVIFGYTDKSRRYLRLAAEHEKRSAAAQNLELKAKFLDVAAQDRDCCARAATGHATAAPPSSVMNSRRPMKAVI
jgi:hypothetical protein